MSVLRRKLSVLGHPSPDRVDPSEEGQFRRLVVWLEDIKIRQCTIDERAPLRAVEGAGWPQQFAKYLARLHCPLPATSPPLHLASWLLALAVRLEFGERPQYFNQKKSPLPPPSESGPEFEAGVAALADLLQVPWHPSPHLRLAAVTSLVTTRLSKEAREDPTIVIPQGPSYSLASSPPLLPPGTSKGVEQAAKVLRLLYIQDLRVLQTQINETIVAVQKITANPKTDTRLGKVGR